MASIAKRIACWIFFGAIMLAAPSKGSETVSVLQAATQTAQTRFPNFRYGDQLAKQEVNCVQFVGAVLERIIQRPLSQKEEDAVYIRYRISDFGSALQLRDERMAGVAKAVVVDLKMGDYVRPADVAPGDFIQYWIKQKDGQWMGHSAIVMRRISRSDGRPAVSLYGAHKSIDHIGETAFGGGGLILDGTDRWFFIARLRPLASAGHPLRGP